MRVHYKHCLGIVAALTWLMFLSLVSGI